MHETALVRDVVHRIEELARSTGARRVTGAKVWLGALSHLSAEHFREHFAIEARDTIAAGATLHDRGVGPIPITRMPSTSGWRASISTNDPAP